MDYIYDSLEYDNYLIAEKLNGIDRAPVCRAKQAKNSDLVIPRNDFISSKYNETKRGLVYVSSTHDSGGHGPDNFASLIDSMNIELTKGLILILYFTVIVFICTMIFYGFTNLWGALFGKPLNEKDSPGKDSPEKEALGDK